MVSYWLYVAVDATLNTGKKTSKMVDLIFSEALRRSRHQSIGPTVLDQDDIEHLDGVGKGSTEDKI